MKHDVFSGDKNCTLFEWPTGIVPSMMLHEPQKLFKNKNH
jgi:hypothetical protein